MVSVTDDENFSHVLKYLDGEVPESHKTLIDDHILCSIFEFLREEPLQIKIGLSQVCRR